MITEGKFHLCLGWEYITINNERRLTVPVMYVYWKESRKTLWMRGTFL